MNKKYMFGVIILVNLFVDYDKMLETNSFLYFSLMKWGKWFFLLLYLHFLHLTAFPDIIN